MKNFLNTIVYPPSLPETQFSQNDRTKRVFIDHFQHLFFGTLTDVWMMRLHVHVYTG